MRARFDVLIHANPFTAEANKQMNRIRNHGHRLHLVFHGMPFAEETEVRRKVIDNRIGFDTLTFGDIPVIPHCALVQSQVDYHELNAAGVYVYMIGKGKPGSPIRYVADMEEFTNTVLILSEVWDNGWKESHVA